ncbi:MAG: hypothetical protein ABJI23_00835 [Marinobacter sp.]|uniref:hypothetical protein n=1 Tax=Marinobacter sp. TaxID=50741 RepID=UPI003297022B
MQLMLLPGGGPRSTLLPTAADKTTNRDSSERRFTDHSLAANMVPARRNMVKWERDRVGAGTVVMLVAFDDGCLRCPQ